MNPTTRTRTSRVRRPVPSITAPTPPSLARKEDRFPDLAQVVRENVRAAARLGPFFRTHQPAARPLFDVFLSGFESPAAAQTHRCHCCRHFIERFGDLVIADRAGHTQSVLWSVNLAGIPQEYRRPVARLREAVEGASVAGVFYDSEEVWGAGPTWSDKHAATWSHFQVQNPNRFRHAILTASQAMAEKEQDFHMLGRALDDYDAKTVNTARMLLESETLFRGEKVLGVATWFHDVHTALAPLRGVARRTALWRFVADAPTGYAHVRSGMIGTLLDDIKDGKSLEECKRAFEIKMDPLKYQRAQSAPSVGNIAQAEKLVEQLGVAPALRRRYARLEDCEKMWVPAPAARPVGGVFGHLMPKQPALAEIPGVTPITWAKFDRDVLPTAERIDVQVPYTGAFIALVTAVDPKAPPILQWDREDARNPVSWYVYPGGSSARTWNLSPGWAPLTGIVRLPHRWGPDGDKFAHQGDGVVLVIDGCRDMLAPRGGGMFTENLRGEYHAIRRTLEAHFLSAPVEEQCLASACGLDLRAGRPWAVEVRVRRANTLQRYRLDRWE